MSIESTIAEHTEALAENTAAMVKLTEVWLQLANKASHIADTAKPGETITAAGKPVAEVKPKADKPKAEPKAEVAADPKPAAEPSTPEVPAAQTASSSEPAPSVDYPVLQKAVFALAGKNREAVVALAGTFGVKTFKELDASKWGEALEAVNAKLAELEAA